MSSILLPGLPWHYFFDLFDAPLPALAVPGFFGGVFFSLVLGTAGRRRRLSEISLPRIAAWGAIGGVLLSLFPAALVLVGLASVEGGSLGIWRLTAVVTLPLTLLSTASATGSLLVARMTENRASLEGGEEMAGIGAEPTGTLPGKREGPG